MLHQQDHRSRTIFTSSISCSAATPKTVRDIVRELKKGELRQSHLKTILCVRPFVYQSADQAVTSLKGLQTEYEQPDTRLPLR